MCVEIVLKEPSNWGSGCVHGKVAKDKIILGWMPDSRSRHCYGNLEEEALVIWKSLILDCSKEQILKQSLEG